MKISTIVLGLLLLSALQCYSQERTVTGTLTDDTGSPLPGVNIVVKGTTQGTVTDAEGRYSIVAPIGSILVFSFIGMHTQEVLVTRHGLSGIKSRIPSVDLKQTVFSDSWANLPADTTGWNKSGVAVIDNKTGKILNNGSIDPDEIVKIRKLGGNYLLHTMYPDNSKHALSLQLTNSIGFESVNRWPSFQSTYAQGRATGGSVQWRGAEQGEMFSYGPHVKTLEYDGSDYTYDDNGRLVTRGTGNGNTATSYDPRKFFRDIVTTSTQLSANFQVQSYSALSGFYERRDRGGITPNSGASTDNFSLRLKDFIVSKALKFTASTTWLQSTGKLLPHGSNLQNIIFSAYRTPPSFNNAGNQSHAPGLADNPYDLADNLPDRDRTRRSTSMVKINYKINDALNVNVNADYDYQSSLVIHGFVPGTVPMPEGRITERNLDRHFFNSITSLNFDKVQRHWGNDWDRSALLAWHTNYQADDLDRADYFGFNRTSYEKEKSTSTQSVTNRLDRTTNEIVVQGGLARDGLRLKVANRNYFSTTVRRGSYVNLFPSASVQYDLAEHGVGIQRLEPYVSISRNIKEAPMIWSNWSHVPTRMDMRSATSFYESGELFFNDNLSPETDARFETGIKSHFWGGTSIELTYYNTTTNNLVAPVWSNGEFTLTNAASVNTNGWLVHVNSRFETYLPDLRFDIALTWSTYNSMVRELNVPGNVVPIAGFKETSAVLAKGQPVGAIYGTSYTRDQSGALVIDAQGFPVVDNKLKVIGNPIPDWIAGSSISVDFAKGFRVWTTLDYRHGGDRWNGTNRVLDYFGVSQTTADQRAINNYVFDGNNVNGKPNVTPVSFADPAGDTADNRWVRDGYAGAAEQYIEDASWVRMSELGISFSASTPASMFVKWIRVSLTARNVFLVTRYHGTDPSGGLFGYANGSGLDLFNMPGVKGIQGSVSIKF